MKSRSAAASIAEMLLATFIRPPIKGRAAWALLSTVVVLIGVWDSFSGIAASFSIFYLVPVALATGWLGARAGVALALAVTLIPLIGDSLGHFPHPLPVHTIWNVATALPIFLFVVWLLHSLIALHRKLEGKVAAQSDKLRESAADRARLELEILDVSERERSAFGRELHDELGQHFVATALAAQTLAEKLGEREGVADAKAIVGWIEEGIAKTRKLARGLLLARIEPARLAQELEELAIGASRGAVQCRMLQQGRPVVADASQCAQLFRIAQEAVGNALRHAHARAIRINLAGDDRALCLTVEDDGCGLPAGRAVAGGMGLRIMEHRARIIGASLSLVSRPGEGTRVICRLPREKSHDL
jgi:signal transduction histidine kinase